MKYFLYKVLPPRPTFPQDMTEASLSEQFNTLKIEQNVLIDYFPCRKINCNRLHVHYWLKMYIFYLHMNMDRMRFMKFLLIEGG